MNILQMIDESARLNAQAKQARLDADRINGTALMAEVAAKKMQHEVETEVARLCGHAPPPPLR